MLSAASMSATIASIPASEFSISRARLPATGRKPLIEVPTRKSWAKRGGISGSGSGAAPAPTSPGGGSCFLGAAQPRVAAAADVGLAEERVGEHADHRGHRDHRDPGHPRGRLAVRPEQRPQDEGDLQHDVEDEDQTARKRQRDHVTSATGTRILTRL